MYAYMGSQYLYLPVHVNNIVCTCKIDTEIIKLFLQSNLFKGINTIQIHCASTTEIDWTSLFFQIF